MHTRLFLVGLLVASLHRAAPADPPLIGIQRLDESTMALNWPAVPGAGCYDLWQSRDGHSWRFLGRAETGPAVLAGVTPPWGEVDVRLFRAVARDDCPPAADPPLDLLAWWPLDGDGNDLTGQGWDLTPVNVSWTGGRYGQAAELNGVDAFLERASASGLNPGSGGWTVCAWVQAIDTPLQGAVLSWYRCGANPGCSSVDASLYNLTLSADHPVAGFRDLSDHDADLTELFPIGDTRWHLVAGALDATDRRWRLYVDASLVHTSEETFGALSPGAVTIPLSIGRIFRTGWAPPHFYLRGRVDDVRIYGRGLSAEEMRALYEAEGWPFTAR